MRKLCGGLDKEMNSKQANNKKTPRVNNNKDYLEDKMKDRKVNGSNESGKNRKWIN